MAATEVDRAVTAIFDIEGYSTESTEQQAELVQWFMTNLDDAYADLLELGPSAIPTGDGAMVAIGRGMHLTPDRVESFVSWVIDFTRELTPKHGIRTGVTYADRELVLDLDLIHIDLPAAHVGQSINEASRLLDYCEPGEILISDGVFRFLAESERGRAYELYPNERFYVKHNVRLQTHSYVPREAERDTLYSPDSTVHRFKRYRGFPKLGPSALDPFLRIRVEEELEAVISYAYEAMRSIDPHGWFLSHGTIIKVLENLARYESVGEAYVVSRNDGDNRFWSHPDSEEYLRQLKKRFREDKLHHTRIVVTDDPPPVAFADGPLAELKRLHAPGTLFAARPRLIEDHAPFLAKLIYGCSVFPGAEGRRPLAVMAFPPPKRVDVRDLRFRSLSDFLSDERMLKDYGHYRNTDGPLRAIVSVNEADVGKLQNEITGLLGLGPEPVK